MKNPHFFSLSGIPKFGKNWLDNFIPSEELQDTFMASEVVRNVLMLQCMFIASVYKDLLRYRQKFVSVDGGESERTGPKHDITVMSKEQAPKPFKMGIIGCG